jgi:hypothetical protein
VFNVISLCFPVPPNCRMIDSVQNETLLQGTIGLMIGNNIPDAYTPFEVATGPTGSPHAT